MNLQKFRQDEISAYVDGELDPERSQAFEIELENNRALKQKVSDYQRMNIGLKEIFDSNLSQPYPSLDNQKKSNNVQYFKLSIAAGLVSIGIFIGILLQSLFITNDVQTTHIENELLSPASFAHAVYTTDKTHPVEVKASSKEHLTRWLSSRLHTEIIAPDLKSINYHLIGGRLLPSTNRMAAQFMYEKKDGSRITLYLRRGVWENQHQSFSFFNSDSTNIFYWINGEMGYAVVGKVNRSELLQIADAIHIQFK